MSKRTDKVPLILFLGILTLHIPGLFFFENFDADAYSRIFISQTFLDQPTFYTEGIWAPLHYYFTALSLLVIPDQVYGPTIFHVVIGSLSVIPIYKTVITIFKNKPAAVFTGLLVVMSPVVFRNSFHALSGGPALFLIAWGMFHVAKIQFDNGTWKNAVWGGLFMTLAAGMRYEAWMFMAFFALFALVTDLKKALIFGAVAGLFPLFWMIGNYVAHQDPFYFLEGARIWNHVMEGNIDAVNPIIVTTRRLFFFYSLCLNLMPWVIVLLIFCTINVVRKRILNWRILLWLGMAIIVLFVFSIKAVNGTLFTQHRFTGLLILLFAPLVGSIFLVIKQRWLLPVGLLSISVSFVLSFYWTDIQVEKLLPDGQGHEVLKKAREWASDQMKAVPRQKTRDAAQLLTQLKQNRKVDDGLIIDFIGWDQTYFVALESRLRRDELHIVPGAHHEQVDINRLSDYIGNKQKPSGYFVCSKDSKLNHYINREQIILSDSTRINLLPKSVHGELLLYTYEFLKTPKSTALPDSVQGY